LTCCARRDTHSFVAPPRHSPLGSHATPTADGRRRACVFATSTTLCIARTVAQIKQYGMYEFDHRN
jgi:hypothetical protein